MNSITYIKIIMRATLAELAELTNLSKSGQDEREYRQYLLKKYSKDSEAGE